MSHCGLQMLFNSRAWIKNAIALVDLGNFLIFLFSLLTLAKGDLNKIFKANFEMKSFVLKIMKHYPLEN